MRGRAARAQRPAFLASTSRLRDANPPHAGGGARCRITIAAFRSGSTGGWHEPCAAAAGLRSPCRLHPGVGDYDEQALGIMQTLGVDRKKTVEEPPAQMLWWVRRAPSLGG